MYLLKDLISSYLDLQQNPCKSQLHAGHRALWTQVQL